MNNPTTPQADAYIPGVCNINHDEIRQRQKAGQIGAAVFLMLLAVLLVLDINRFVRIFLFLPAFVAAIGYLQAKNKFCVGYGAAGMQNAGEGSTAASQISDQTAVSKDKVRARRMNLQAAAIAIAATAIALSLSSFS